MRHSQWTGDSSTVGAATTDAAPRVRPESSNLSATRLEFMSTVSNASIMDASGTFSTNSSWSSRSSRAWCSKPALTPIWGGSPFTTNVQSTEISSGSPGRPFTVSRIAGQGGIIGPGSPSARRGPVSGVAELVGLPSEVDAESSALLHSPGPHPQTAAMAAATDPPSRNRLLDQPGMTASDDTADVQHPQGRSSKREPGRARRAGKLRFVGWRTGLERRPLVGTRCATAQRTAGRRPAGWFSLGATGRMGRSRTSVTKGE